MSGTSRPTLSQRLSYRLTASRPRASSLKTPTPDINIDLSSPARSSSSAMPSRQSTLTGAGPSGSQPGSAPRSPALHARLVEPSDSTYPRRRVSLSVNSPPMINSPLLGPTFAGSSHAYQQPQLPHPHPSHSLSHTHSRHHGPRRRARTMSTMSYPYPVRSTRHVSGFTRRSRYRNTIFTVIILLSLFLTGTVVVLSSVSYYLAIPTWAYLTEDEVGWKTSDLIPSLKYSPAGTATQQKRALPEEWPLSHDEELELDSDDIWDVDGPGSGKYWMRRDWDGHVDEVDWRKLTNVTERPGEKIPRLIHQTWKDEFLPVKWRKAWKECREGMPEYDYMLWTDEAARDFIKTEYPAHLHMYDSYKYPIQRADSIRYFVLHHFGGVYMDLDIGCRRRLDPLLKGDWDAILPITKPVGVSNDLMLSRKESPFIDDTVHALPAWNHEWVSNYPTVMFSTGPMFLSAQFSIYTSAHPLTATHPRSDVRILPKSLYGKNAKAEDVPHSFFAHFYGSSWHSDDAGFITFLGVWGKKMMLLGLMVILGGVLRLVYHKARRSRAKTLQLFSVLPTSSGSKSRTRDSSPDDLDDISSQSLPQDIGSTLKRAGNLILAGPAALVPPTETRRNRRRTGLLFFVPAIFQAAPTVSRRGRTTSEASQLPLRRSRREREKERSAKEDAVDTVPPPPPYERALSAPSVQLIHDEPESMEIETSETGLSSSENVSPQSPNRMGMDVGIGMGYNGFLRDIESGSSSATEEVDDTGRVSGDSTDWSDWRNKGSRR